jgi:hypothetical protein
MYWLQPVSAFDIEEARQYGILESHRVLRRHCLPLGDLIVRTVVSFI